MNLIATKLEIIKAIADLESEVLLRQILAIIPKPTKKVQYQPMEDDLLMVAREPAPKYLSIETLKKEQNYNIEKLRTHYRTMDRSIWEGEDIVELMKDLK